MGGMVGPKQPPINAMPNISKASDTCTGQAASCTTRGEGSTPSAYEDQPQQLHGPASQGNEDEENIFRRSSLIPRERPSPQERERARSWHEEREGRESKEAEEGDRDREGKRKQRDSLEREMKRTKEEDQRTKEPIPTGETKEIILEAMKKMEAMVGCIQQNTSVPLKNNIRAFQRTITKLQRTYEREERQRIDKIEQLTRKIENIEINMAKSDEAERTNSRQNNETCTQTESENEERASKERQKIMEYLRGEKKPSKLLEIIDLKWEEEMFKRAKWEEISENSHVAPGAIIFVEAETEEISDNKIVQKFLDKETRDEIKQIKCIKEGEYIKIARNTTITWSDKTSRQRKNVYVIGVKTKEEPKSGINGDLYANLEAIFNESAKGETETTRLLALSDKRSEKTRKIIEYLTAGLNVRVALETQEHEDSKRGTYAGAAKASGKNETVQKLYNKKRYVEIKLQEGHEYEETLKRLRKAINIKDTNVKVEGIFRTNEGNIRIAIIEKIPGACAEFKTKAENPLQLQTTVKEVMGRTTTFIIRDLDSAVTEGEVKRGIEEATGITLREGRYTITIKPDPKRKDSKIAYTTLNRDEARTLTGKARINLEWARCRISELIRPDRCFKCGSLQHAIKDCEVDGKEREKDRCYNCHKKGHKRSECQHESYCTDCDVVGHAINTMKCPKYREAVVRIREEKRTARIGSVAERQVTHKEKEPEKKREPTSEDRMEIVDETAPREAENTGQMTSGQSKEIMVTEEEFKVVKKKKKEGKGKGRDAGSPQDRH
nr:uncharacterized protein LOC111419141 [Onthophagus taurus]